MTRTRIVSVDLTERDILMNSECLFLASVIMKDPEMVKDNPKALEAVIDLLDNIESWKEYCLKMQEICIKAQTTSGT